eukprot:11209238-Lingulodinium_polyedra.AAC.2
MKKRVGRQQRIWEFSFREMLKKRAVQHGAVCFGRGQFARDELHDSLGVSLRQVWYAHLPGQPHSFEKTSGGYGGVVYGCREARGQIRAQGGGAKGGMNLDQMQAARAFA